MKFTIREDAHPDTHTQYLDGDRQRPQPEQDPANELQGESVKVDQPVRFLEAKVRKPRMVLGSSPWLPVEFTLRLLDR